MNPINRLITRLFGPSSPSSPASPSPPGNASSAESTQPTSRGAGQRVDRFAPTLLRTLDCADHYQSIGADGDFLRKIDISRDGTLLIRTNYNFAAGKSFILGWDVH